MQTTIKRPEIIIPEKLEEEKDVNQIMVVAQSLEITSQDQAEKAAEELKIIKSKWKDLEAKRKTLAIPIDASKKALQELFVPILNRYTQAEGLIKSAILKFNQKQEAIRREEERKAQEKFQREQEKERLAVEARIAKAKEKGDEVKAESLKEKIEEKPFVPAPTITASPKLKGFSTRKIWRYKVTDFAKVPDEYKLINDKMCSGMATATKGAIQAPGIEFYCEETASVRT
jgi:hypothetical protein